MTNAESSIPGWYGKIPNLGDFASRRLPSRFIVPWDDWLQRALAGSRAILGDGWLDIYLTSPVWRFMLLPGVCGNEAWAGVIMPSVDRVGRYFPLSIAVALALPPARESQFDELSSWLDRIEGAALAALDLQHTADDLDRVLAANPVPAFGDVDDGLELLQQRLADGLMAHNAPTTTLALPALAAMPALLNGAGTRFLLRAAGGKSLWWSRNRHGAAPALICCEALPAADDFAMLLGGGTIATLPTTSA